MTNSEQPFTVDQCPYATDCRSMLTLRSSFHEARAAATEAALPDTPAELEIAANAPEHRSDLERLATVNPELADRAIVELLRIRRPLGERCVGCAITGMEDILGIRPESPPQQPGGAVA